jgi:hypothetical protein
LTSIKLRDSTVAPLRGGDESSADRGDHGSREMSDAKAQARAKRLKAALRDNLKRRKAQARGRESATEPGEEQASDAPLPPKGRAD